jgi:predicted transcriptional regulator of viral defense system
VAGGIDNAATVIVELAESAGFSMAELVEASSNFPISTVRRLGWLLETFGEDIPDLGTLRSVAFAGPSTPARLDPIRDLSGPRDDRWRVRINREVEPDL